MNLRQLAVDTISDNAKAAAVAAHPEHLPTVLHVHAVVSRGAPADRPLGGFLKSVSCLTCSTGIAVVGMSAAKLVNSAALVVILAGGPPASDGQEDRVALL